MAKTLLAAASALVAAGCATYDPPGARYPAGPLYPPGADPLEAAEACPITGSREWAAWVNAMPGPQARPKLVVTGKVTVPTGGYRIVWEDVRVAESYPVQIFAELRAIPPSGVATQVVTTHNVRGEWAVSPPVGSVTITCGDRVLTRVSPVETAH